MKQLGWLSWKKMILGFIFERWVEMNDSSISLIHPTGA